MYFLGTVFPSVFFLLLNTVVNPFSFIVHMEWTENGAVWTVDISTPDLLLFLSVGGSQCWGFSVLGVLSVGGSTLFFLNTSELRRLCEVTYWFRVLNKIFLKSFHIISNKMLLISSYDLSTSRSRFKTVRVRLHNTAL